MRCKTIRAAWPVFAAALIFLPWLNPFAPGPTSAVVPWLMALAAVAGLLGSRFFWQQSNYADVSGWSHPAATAWLLAGVISSAIALVQYLGLSASLSPWINTTPLGEAFGNLRQRNQFASLTNIALAALLWWAVQPRLGQFEKTARIGVMLAAVLLGIGNAVSSSRTGLFQSVLLVAMAWYWGGLRKPAVQRVVIGFGLAYVLALLVLPFMVGLDPWSTGAWARLQAGDAVCSSRLTLWHNVLTLIAQHPWRGWGWGELDYAHYITLYDGPRFCDILDNAHNLPLHLAVELGIPVSFTACSLLLLWIWRSKPWAETDSTRQMAWSVLAVIGLHSLLEYPLWYGPFQMAVGLCVILLWRGRPAIHIKNQALAQVGYALAATVLGATVCYAAWDYHRISQVYLPIESRDPAYRMDTLEKIRGSYLFQDQVRFAELSVTPLTQNNAAAQYRLALDLLHFSPERRVIERVIDSALVLGYDDVVVFHLLRLKAAFPEAYAEWMAAHKPPR